MKNKILFSCAVLCLLIISAASGYNWYWNSHKNIEYRTDEEANKKAIDAYDEFLNDEQEVYVKDEHLNNLSNDAVLPEKFTLLYNGQDTGIEILTHIQNRRYDKNGVLVYSEFVSDYYESEIEIPRCQWVLYIHTPFLEQQIFPVKDLIVDEDTETLYIYRETSDVELIEKINLADEYLETETISELLLEDRIISEYQLPSDGKALSDLQFKFTSIENGEAGYVLKGEAEGIYKDTGEKYYIDWEWNGTTKKEEITPYILEKWDAKKDKDIFDKCNEIFDRIEQGDWSDVPPLEGMEYMWGMNGTEGDWIRVDVNQDGLPELISQCGNGQRTENKRPIDLIFSWNKDKVELVYTDLIDAAGFYYCSGNGKLIYEYQTLMQDASYSQCIFDVNWKNKNLYTLRFDREFSEATCEAVMTFYSVRPKTSDELKDNPDNNYWVQEIITQEQFLEYYKEMTGVDFIKDNEDWKSEFQ